MKINKGVTFMVTIIGIIVIIIASVGVSLYQDEQDKYMKYFEENVKSMARKCVNDNICNMKDITFDILIKNNYLKGDILKEAEKYSMNSYVEKDTYKIYLVEKLKN